MTGRRLFIGNLPFTTTEQQLRAAFQDCGTIIQIRMPHDPNTQKFRGFAFIEFSTEVEAQAAIERWHDTEVGGRRIIVNEAKEPRGSRDRTGHYRGQQARREARW